MSTTPTPQPQPSTFMQNADQAIAAGSIDSSDVEDRRHNRDTLFGRLKDDFELAKSKTAAVVTGMKDQFEKQSQPSSTILKFGDKQQKPAPDFIPDAAPDFIPYTSAKPTAPTSIPPGAAKDVFKAGVHAKILGISPGSAYQNREAIDAEFRNRGGEGYDDGKLDPTIANDIRVGYQSSILGLRDRNALPSELRNPSKVDRFISGLSQLFNDLPYMVAGGIAGGAAGAAAGSEAPVIGNITVGGAGAAAGAFALPAALREALTQNIKNGEAKSFSEVLRRAAASVWEGAKGAITGVATEAAGGLPVGSLIAKSGVATVATKAAYQATAMTTAADLLEGKLPTADDFTANALMIVPLNLLTHGTLLRGPETKQAVLDSYAKTGRTPEATKTLLDAQPPVKPDMPPGLTPAIQYSEGVIEADANETHADVAERVLAKKPVTMEELEANPAKADDVLSNPKPHSQDVIDRAWQIKKDAIDAGDLKAPEGGEKPQSIEDLYDRNAMKSGRGFTTPDGEFLSRMEARKWMKDNEPDVHDMWADIAGDKSAELHSEDYGVARMRVQARNLAEGDPVASALPEDLQRFVAQNRDGILNKIKAGSASEKYGYEATRTMLVGPRDYLRAQGEQIVSRLRKEVPDRVDQEALHFFRDYRDDPFTLTKDIEEIKSGENEKLKQSVLPMERAAAWHSRGENGQIALPEKIAQADAAMTNYFAKALSLGQEVGTLRSGIDPSRYSPRLFMRATDGETTASGLGKPNFTDKTVNSIRREYLRTLDPLKSGETEARTFNAFDEMSIYNDRHAVAVSTALFKNELKNSALGVEGSRSKVPADWVPLTKNFEDKRTIEQEDGSTVTTVKNFYVPPDIEKALRPLMADPNALAQLSGYLKLQSLVKGIELSLSAFHIKAMNITAFNNMGLKNLAQSLHLDNSAPDFEANESRFALHGLTTSKTGTPVDAYKGLKADQKATGLARLRDNFAVRAVDAAAKKTTELTFDVVQRHWKVTDMATKEAGWVADHPQATEAEYASAMRGYAKEVNASYGGLNWDVMGVSKSALAVSRLFLLAPDWTFSNVANFKYALTDRGTAGSASQAFLAKSFITGFAMTAAASIFFGGKYDWTDWKHIDQVYLGKDKDGKEMYANWFFAGAPKDAINLVKRSVKDGPVAAIAEMIVSKANPIPQTTYDIAKNKDYKGAPIYKSKDNALVKSGKDVLYAGEKLVPITGTSVAETIGKVITDPKHEFSYQQVFDLAADLSGSPTYHEGGKAKGGSVAPAGSTNKKSGTSNLPGSKPKKFSIRSGR